MGKLEWMRRGMEKLIGLDGGIGTVTRSIKADNGTGGTVPTGETAQHKLWCRVSHQSGGA